LAYGIGREARVRAEELERVLPALVTGDGQTGQDPPGVLATEYLVAPGVLAGNHRGSRSAFGAVVGSPQRRIARKVNSQL